MIDARELRIGNYFKYNKKHNEGLCMLNIPMKWDDSDWYQLGECIIFLDWFDPIPITEEILLKCGFTYKLGDLDFKLPNGLLYYDVKEKKMYLMVGQFADCTDTVPCDYLHQLQNIIFSLTGKELKFNL